MRKAFFLKKVINNKKNFTLKKRLQKIRIIIKDSANFKVTRYDF